MRFSIQVTLIAYLVCNAAALVKVRRSVGWKESGSRKSLPATSVLHTRHRARKRGLYFGTPHRNKLIKRHSAEVQRAIIMTKMNDNCYIIFSQVLVRSYFRTTETCIPRGNLFCTPEILMNARSTITERSSSSFLFYRSETTFVHIYI